jgi:hypothetical protein
MGQVLISRSEPDLGIGQDKTFGKGFILWSIISRLLLATNGYLQGGVTYYGIDRLGRDHKLQKRLHLAPAFAGLQRIFKWFIQKFING